MHEKHILELSELIACKLKTGQTGGMKNLYKIFLETHIC